MKVKARGLQNSKAAGHDRRLADVVRPMNQKDRFSGLRSARCRRCNRHSVLAEGFCSLTSNAPSGLARQGAQMSTPSMHSPSCTCFGTVPIRRRRGRTDDSRTQADWCRSGAADSAEVTARCRRGLNSAPVEQEQGSGLRGLPLETGNAAWTIYLERIHILQKAPRVGTVDAGSNVIPRYTLSVGLACRLARLHRGVGAAEITVSAALQFYPAHSAAHARRDERRFAEFRVRHALNRGCAAGVRDLLGNDRLEPTARGLVRALGLCIGPNHAARIGPAGGLTYGRIGSNFGHAEYRPAVRHVRHHFTEPNAWRQAGRGRGDRYSPLCDGAAIGGGVAATVGFDGGGLALTATGAGGWSFALKVGQSIPSATSKSAAAPAPT
jgi:hypothetical protein